MARRVAAAADAKDQVRADADAGDAAHYRWDGDGLVLEILGKPGARRDGFVRVAGGRLSVRIAAVAEGGRATARLLAFLADEFGVARSAVELVAGAASPVKRVRVRAPALLPAGAGVRPRRS